MSENANNFEGRGGGQLLIIRSYFNMLNYISLQLGGQCPSVPPSPPPLSMPVMIELTLILNMLAMYFVYLIKKIHAMSLSVLCDL